MPKRGPKDSPQRRLRRVGPRIVRGISAGSRWPTSDRVAKLADIGLKLTALVVAVLAAGLFAGPEVELDRKRFQAFIDVRDLENRYIEVLKKRAPYLVVTSAREYNTLNELDILEPGENPSSRVHPVSELCTSARDVLEELFPSIECDLREPFLPSPSRGRTYDRLLIANAADSLDIGQLRDAMLLMRDSEYLVARYIVRNDGGGYATNVRLSAPELFLPSDDQPFSLPPDKEYTVRFETLPGAVERDPKDELLRVNISWEPGGGAISRFWTLIVAGLLALLVALTLWNDLREGAQQAAVGAEGSEGSRSPP